MLKIESMIDKTPKKMETIIKGLETIKLKIRQCYTFYNFGTKIKKNQY